MVLPIDSASSLLMLQALELIYDAACDHTIWPSALQAIADCFNDVGALLIWAKDDGSFGTIVSPSLEVGQRDYEHNGWSALDIRARRSVERGYFFSGAAFTDRHICSPDEIETHPCYAQFLAKHGLGYVGAIAVSPDPRIGVMLCIQRNASTRQPFDEKELKLIGRIGPHVERSLRLSIRLIEGKHLGASLGDALTRIDVAIFALDSVGRVTFNNLAGTRLLGNDVSILQGKLVLGSDKTRDDADATIRKFISRGPEEFAGEQRPLIVERRSSGRPLVVYLLPVGEASSAAGGLFSGARALVLIIEPELNRPPDPALVRDVLGVTLGEARVASMVGSGLSPKESAVNLGIAEETARNLLKRVFAKVGISRQSELSLLLSKLSVRSD